MIIRQFPDINWLKHQIETGFKNAPTGNGTGWPSLILQVKSSAEERKDVKGPFSIFTNKRGNSIIGVEGREIKVTEDLFVMTNEDDHYDLIVPPKEQETETFNIHFGTAFCANAFHYFKHSDKELLDQLESEEKLPHMHFRSFFKDAIFYQLSENLEKAYCTKDSMLLDEARLNLFQHILQQSEGRYIQNKDWKTLKKQTREELFKRVCISVDYMNAYYMKHISLDQLSEVCFISKFHYTRVFKRLFKVTPYQYLKQIRLEKALQLIHDKQFPIHEIALKVGLENSSSLSRFVYQQTGKYPTDFKED